VRLSLPFLTKPAEKTAGVVDERAKVAWFDEMYRVADAQRRQYENDMQTNILFLAGRHYEEAVRDELLRSRRVYNPAPQTKVKLTSNMVYVMARQASSGLRDNIAMPVAIAATSEPDDIAAADVGTDFLQSRLTEDNESEVRLLEILWAMVAGRCLRMTYFDPDADGVGRNGPLSGVGDLKSITINPLRFLLCPWQEEPGKMPWVILSDVRDVDEVNDLYPGHDVKSEEYADAQRVLDRVALAVVEGAEGGGSAKKENACVFKQLYADKTKAWPKGRLMVVAGGKLLHEGPLPDGVMPFVPLDWFPMPGRLYPLPFVTPMRDVQREINFTISQLVELRNRQLRGDVVIRGGGKVLQEVDPETGRKDIFLTGAEEFAFLKYDLNTTEAEILLSRLWEYLQQLAGQRDPSIGKNPQAAKTATAVQILHEADVQGMTLFRAGFDQAHCKIAQHKLLMAQRHYKVARMIRVVGEENRVRVRSFFGSDLRNTQDVRAVPRPILSQSQIVMVREDAIAQGLYGPYLGPDDMLAKLTALRGKPLPGIQEEVEQMLAPMTLDELRNIVGKLNVEKAKLALLGVEAQGHQLTLGIVAGQAQVEQIAQQQGAEQQGSVPTMQPGA